MTRFIFGGRANYGQVAGILMLDSTIPRIPGDPGHAETFDSIHKPPALPVRIEKVLPLPGEHR